MTAVTRRLSGAQRAFFTGTVWVAAGTVLLGVSGLAFLVLAPAHVSPSDYAALSSVYLLMGLAGWRTWAQAMRAGSREQGARSQT